MKTSYRRARDEKVFGIRFCLSGFLHHHDVEPHIGLPMAKRILIICTGNSCRSQMAEGFLRSFDQTLEVYSAGTEPASKVSAHAIAAMKEVGIDIGRHSPKHVNQFIKHTFDYVITVCDDANESCPVFLGSVKHRVHIGFDDPTWTMGTEEEVVNAHRSVRDQIKSAFSAFYEENLKGTEA
jgi:arsenate reductase (thioredoxin)